MSTEFFSPMKFPEYLLFKLIHTQIHRCPFDTKNPFGYLVAVIPQTILASYHFYFTGTITAFGIGTYLFLFSPIADIRSGLTPTDEKTKMEKSRLRDMKHLCEFIEIHAASKQLSHKILSFNPSSVNKSSFLF